MQQIPSYYRLGSLLLSFCAVARSVLASSADFFPTFSPHKLLLAAYFNYNAYAALILLTFLLLQVRQFNIPRKELKMSPSEDIFVRAERGIQSALAQLPTWMSRFFGYRGKPNPPSSNLLVCIWGFIGAFGGLGVILAVFTTSQYFTSRHVPAIVASYVSFRMCFQHDVSNVNNKDTGCVSYPVLWRYRRPTGTAACFGFWPFLQWSCWRHRVRHLQLQAHSG